MLLLMNPKRSAILDQTEVASASSQSELNWPKSQGPVQCIFPEIGGQADEIRFQASGVARGYAKKGVHVWQIATSRCFEKRAFSGRMA